MSSADAIQDSTNSPPEWATLTIELYCPRCGYNLRMLTGSRCPECGLDLNWGRIIASAQKRVISPLFEYKWRTRPARSYFRTLARCVRPSRLWTGLSVMDEPQAAPLALFGLITIVLYAGLPTIIDVADFLIRFRKGAWAPWKLDMLERLCTESTVTSSIAALVHILVVLTIWSFLQLFRQTMVRYRIRQAQWLRLVVLGCTPLLVVKFFEVVCLSYWTAWTLRSATTEWMIVLDLAAIVLTVRSLYFGLSVYLRIKQGGLVALAVVSLTALFWTASVVIFSVVWGDWNNPVANAVYFNWSGFDRIISQILGLSV